MNLRHAVWVPLVLLAGGVSCATAGDAPQARDERGAAREDQASHGRLRQKYLNARTREYKYAAYMDAWRAKVERVGNLNYSELAKRQDLAGSLILDVALNPDGTLHGVEVLRSSGHPLLDEAAIRIVRLAAPFEPFPPGIRAEADVLHITRTWRFQETGADAGDE